MLRKLPKIPSRSLQTLGSTFFNSKPSPNLFRREITVSRGPSAETVMADENRRKEEQHYKSPEYRRRCLSELKASIIYMAVATSIFSPVFKNKWEDSAKSSETDVLRIAKKAS